ncbi:MAG: acyltransferase family protein [Candidatus Fimenecus sp.]
MGNIKKKDATVSILRVLAMLMIVLCHTIEMYPIPYAREIGPLLALGVEVFLLISGYLYGMKTIQNTKQWLLRSYLKIWLPMFFVAVMWFFIFGITKYQANPWCVFIYLFDLQGLGWIHEALTPPQWAGVSYCWFLTIIFICYCLVPLLQRIRKVIVAHPWLFFVGAVAVSYLAGLAKIRFAYFCAFIIGYTIGACRQAEKPLLSGKIGRQCLVSAAFFAGTAALFIVANKGFHSSNFYIFSCWPNLGCGLAVFLFCAVSFFTQKFQRLTQKIVQNKVFCFAESIAFSVYLLHVQFFQRSFDLFGRIENLALATVVFLVLLILFSALFTFVDTRVQAYVGKCIEKIGKKPQKSKTTV